MSVRISSSERTRVRAVSCSFGMPDVGSFSRRPRRTAQPKSPRKAHSARLRVAGACLESKARSMSFAVMSLRSFLPNIRSSRLRCQSDACAEPPSSPSFHRPSGSHRAPTARAKLEALAHLNAEPEPRRGLGASGHLMNGIHEVTGSIPVSSTKPGNNLARRPTPLTGRFVYFLSIFTAEAAGPTSRTRRLLPGGAMLRTVSRSA
jgi:hypothetical protein